MASFYKSKSNSYFFKFHKNKRGYLICNQELLFIPVRDRDNIIWGKSKHANLLFDPSAHVISVSDCFIIVQNITRLPSIKGRLIFNIALSAMPTYKVKKSKYDYYDYQYVTISVKVDSDRLKFDIQPVIRFATGLEFHIYDEQHFKNAVYDLLEYELSQAQTRFPMYFSLGYKNNIAFDYFYRKDEERLFLPYSQTDDLSYKTAVDEMYEYIRKQPSAAMLLAYTFFAVSYYFIERYLYKNNNKLLSVIIQNKLIFSMNYYGDDLRQVYQDVNLFCNFFKSNTPKTVTGAENIVLDSVRYDIDNHVRFKDITLVVTAKNHPLSPSNKFVKEIIALRASGSLPFAPIFISKKSFQYAEVVSVQCDNKILSKSSEYFRLKQCTNRIMSDLISYMFAERNKNMYDIVESIMSEATIEQSLRYTNFYDAVSRMLLLSAVGIISDVMSHLGHTETSLELIKTLRTVLNIQLTDAELADVSYGNSLHDLPDFALRIIDFIKRTYLEHKDDNPQVTVWAEKFDESSVDVFSPFEVERLWIYIDNNLVERFIKENIADSSHRITDIKSFMTSNRLMRKNGRRYVFKKHDHGEHLCWCFYVEFER